MNPVKRLAGVFAIVWMLCVAIPMEGNAQCAMCTLTAENATENGNTQGNGLNKGILFLLAIPYLAAVGIGLLWYKRYRSKKSVDVDDDPIVLN